MNLDRSIYNSVIGSIGRREIGIIVGPRQVGKTTLLKEIAGYCKNNRIAFKYYNLEMPADAGFFARTPANILADLTRNKNVVLIDEFHYLPNATKLFKAIYDGYPDVKVFASGSSAIEMHKHLKESLAGRRHLFRMFPLSFWEWLPCRTTSLKKPESFDSEFSAQTHEKLKTFLDEFVIFGGMPGLVHEKSRDFQKRLLLDLVATYMQKDIKALLREEDILSFNRMLALLASQEGNLLSENNVSNSLNYSLRQVRNDLAILDQTFLLNILKPFHANRGRELKQTNKTYFFDSGIRNAILQDFRIPGNRPDKGALMEAFVLQEIQKHMRVTQELFYWRTREKNEVDFILVQDRTPVPVEVKSQISAGEIPGGIKQFFANYKESRLAVVLNDSIRALVKYEGRKILFAPHYYAALIPELF
ncbi:MAG: ATP-binding protein [Planctomycetes bacterium]|nr:ATP-binding protein [Planctomycetota bacterium]